MSGVLHGLALPLREHTVVLPSAAIAEIIPYEKPDRILESPPWLVGILNWRGIHTPLTYLELMESHLTFETVNNLESEINHDFLIVILNRIYEIKGAGLKTEENQKYPFFAIVIEHMPKLLRLTSEMIHVVADLSDKSPRFLMEVTIKTEQAFIPNLISLWKMIDALPPRLQWFQQITI